MKRIVLIDGHNLLFRMFYGIPTSIKNTKGKEIRGLIGFIGSLKKLVDKFNPDSLVVIFDSETSRNNNLKIDKDYKSNRLDYTDIEEEENPFSQLSLIKKALDYLNITYIEVENDEADDYIASIVSNILSNKNQYIIVSTDFDFIQLISSNIFLYVPRGKNSILYDEKEVIKKYNIRSNQYILLKSLVGDKSDNIKGVSGIGNITASKILKYETLYDFILDNPNSRYSKLLLDNKETIEKNKKLITMNRNLDVSKIIFQELSNKLMNDKTYEIIENIGER